LPPSGSPLPLLSHSLFNLSFLNFLYFSPTLLAALGREGFIFLFKKINSGISGILLKTVKPTCTFKCGVAPMEQGLLPGKNKKKPRVFLILFYFFYFFCPQLLIPAPCFIPKVSAKAFTRCVGFLNQIKKLPPWLCTFSSC
jgi:hypothetical protein